MSPEAAITRGVLSHAVKDRLLERIIAGAYPPGSRIVETRVARELGTSQAPVREALRDLEALGVVEISPFRGARVRRPGLDELLEAYGVRAELEAMAVRLAMPRLGPADLDAMAALIDEMRRCADDGDTVGEAAADAAFHGALVDRAGNATLRRLWGQLEPYSRTYINLAVPGATGARWPTSTSPSSTPCDPATPRSRRTRSASTSAPPGPPSPSGGRTRRRARGPPRATPRPGPVSA